MHGQKEKGTFQVFYDFNVNGHYIESQAGVTTVNKHEYQQEWQHLPYRIVIR